MLYRSLSGGIGAEQHAGACQPAEETCLTDGVLL